MFPRQIAALQVKAKILSTLFHVQAAGRLAASDPHNPAPKKDRITGSDKNAPGTASADGGSIEVSEEIEKGLAAKLAEHNDLYGDDPKKRTTLEVLKKVWRRGAGAYSTSHRRTVNSRQQWAFGRVDAFLYLLRTGSPRNPKYTTDYDLLPSGHPKSTRNK